MTSLTKLTLWIAADFFLGDSNGSVYLQNKLQRPIVDCLVSQAINSVAESKNPSGSEHLRQLTLVISFRFAVLKSWTAGTAHLELQL
jgi:hypothetical protein